MESFKCTLETIEPTKRVQVKKFMTKRSIIMFMLKNKCFYLFQVILRNIQKFEFLKQRAFEIMDEKNKELIDVFVRFLSDYHKKSKIDKKSTVKYYELILFCIRNNPKCGKGRGKRKLF